jgi:hypothetical protein
MVGGRRNMVLDARGGKSASLATSSNLVEQQGRAGQEAVTVAEKPLAVTTENEYGVRKAEDFFVPFLRGRDDPSSALLVEPHRTTTLSIPEPSKCATCSYSWTLSSDGVVQKGPSVVVKLASTGKQHLTLREYDSGDESADVVRRERVFDVYGKYVRRELRQLTAEDRTDFMDAASTMWKISTVEGQKTYGDRYYDIHYLAIVHNDLAGNAGCDFIHGNEGYSFLNSHSSLNMMLEQSVQAINPRLSLPYWDYTLDATRLSGKYQTPDGTSKTDGNLLRIWQSDVFSAAYFGSPDSSTGAIQDGRWSGAEAPKLTDDLVQAAGISGHFQKHGFGSCYGQDPSLCNQPTLSKLKGVGASTQHQKNSFGLLRAPWNMYAESAITRRSEVCGMPNNLQFPTCHAVADCYTSFTSFQDYIVNLQLSPHGTVHIFTGGAFGACADTFPSLQATLSDSTTSTMVHESIMGKVPDIQKDLWAAGIKTCPSEDECAVTLAQGGTCACSCPEFDSSATWAGESADDMRATSLWVILSTSASIDELDSALSSTQLAAIANAACNTDTLTGDMVGSNSPLDIAFFSTHGEVERMFQRKMVSGTMEDMSWPQTDGLTCPGQKADWRNLWFDYTFSAAPSGATLDSKALTNEEMLTILDPNSKLHEDHMPYVYGNLEWAHCVLGTDGITSPYLSDEWIWDNKKAASSSSVEDASTDAIVASGISVSLQQGTQRSEVVCDSSFGPVLDGVDFVDLVTRNTRADAVKSAVDPTTLTSPVGRGTDPSTPPAIGVVEPLQGLDTITATFGGYTFWFQTKENRDMFVADPASYVPRYGGFDAYSLAVNAYDLSSGDVSMPSASIAGTGSYDFTHQLRPAFFKSSAARESMLKCGEECYAAAQASFESMAEGSHCFNTQHVEL